jgi:hypothetical protein
MRAGGLGVQGQPRVYRETVSQMNTHKKNRTTYNKTIPLLIYSTEMK